MRRSLSTSFALAVAASLLATPTLAQEIAKLGLPGGHGFGAPHHGPFTFGVGGGLALPVNDAKDALKNGFNGIAYARFQVPRLPLSVGLNVSFQRFDLKDARVSTGGGAPIAASGSSDLLGGLGDLKYELMPGPIRPYITLGLGAYNLKETTTGTGASSASKTHFGVNGGVGVSARIAGISAFVQGRIDNVYSDTGGVINAKSVQVVPVTLGIEF